MAAVELLPETLRPPNRYTEPGGLIHLSENKPTLVIPDLHGRREFLWKLLAWRPDKGFTVEELLEQDRLQLVSLGDILHGEGRVRHRWQEAYQEYREGYGRHLRMDEEMRESLGTAEALLILQNRFPGSVFILKGNHENITNRRGHGDYPFLKFADEGAMVLGWMEKFYPPEVLYWYARWEESMAFLAQGACFLLSHAPPGDIYPPEKIVEAADYPEVVEGLTWTRGGDIPGNVQGMLGCYLGEAASEAFYFCGHRTISGLFARESPKLVEFHDPEAYNMAYLPGGERFINLEKDMIAL